MNRREACGCVGAGIGIVLSGCLSRDGANEGGGPENGTDDAVSTPEYCPNARDLGVDPPAEVTEESVREYVAEYERAYLDRFVVGERRPVDESPFPSIRDVSADGSGYAVEVETGWSREWGEGVLVTAEPADDVPDGVTPLEADELDGVAEPVAEAARRAADDDAEARWEDSMGRNAHEPILEELGSAHEESAAYYVTADDVPVRARVGPAYTVVSDDVTYSAYYVDDASVRRETGPDADPREGRVLECFESDAERRITETP